LAAQILDMKKTKATSGRRSSRVSPGAREAQSPADLGAVRQQITDLIAKNAVGMVETTIEQAAKGHYQAMKYLFEIVGLYPATAAEDNPEEESLAAILLGHLRIPIDPSPDEGLPSDCGSDTMA
jgi:hypothetical protein